MGMRGICAQLQKMIGLSKEDLSFRYQCHYLKVLSDLGPLLGSGEEDLHP